MEGRREKGGEGRRREEEEEGKRKEGRGGRDKREQEKENYSFVTSHLHSLLLDGNSYY